MNKAFVMFVLMCSLLASSFGQTPASVGEAAATAVPVKTNIVLTLSRGGQIFCTGLQPGSVATLEYRSIVLGYDTQWWTVSKVLADSNGAFSVSRPIDGPGEFFRVHAEPPVTVETPTGMVLVPAGEFMIGYSDSRNGRVYELSASVYVSAFHMNKTEVTRALWDEVYAWAVTHGYDFENTGSGKAANHPVNMISWNDAVKWCNARSEKEGLVPAYYTDAAQTIVWRSGVVTLDNSRVKWNSGYRLPTNAEWQKAARGGTEWIYPCGDTISQDQANFMAGKSSSRAFHPDYSVGEFPYTSPVGAFAPNGYDLYDMAGNVDEWCWDVALDMGYQEYVPNGSDPKGFVSGLARITHGGDWGSHQDSCHISWHQQYDEGYYQDNLGFRCVLPVKE